MSNTGDLYSSCRSGTSGTSQVKKYSCHNGPKYQENLYQVIHQAPNRYAHRDTLSLPIITANEAGNYTTHVYVDYKMESWKVLTSVRQPCLHENQRWVHRQPIILGSSLGWEMYGVSNVDQSGCAPASLAMITTVSRLELFARQ